MADNQVARWTGGSPLAVLGRLVLLSVLVGVILSALGLDPLAVALLPARSGYRHSDLDSHAPVQCTAR